jgi:hypothetical protein
VPYCPRCRCEYNIGVEQCVDCHLPLVLRRPQRRPLLDFDFDELLVPLGALFCLLASLALYGVRTAAAAGQIQEPLGSLINAQPGIFTIFYVVAAVLSGLTLVAIVFRWIFFRG